MVDLPTSLFGKTKVVSRLKLLSEMVCVIKQPSDQQWFGNACKITLSIADGKDWTKNKAAAQSKLKLSPVKSPT